MNVESVSSNKKENIPMPLYKSRIACINLIARSLFDIISGSLLFVTGKIIKSHKLSTNGAANLLNGISRIFALYMFRKKLIASSINSPQNYQMASAVETFKAKIEELKSKIVLGDYKFADLSEDFWAKGVCHGEAIDFISRYLELIERYPNPLERLIQVTKEYENGARQKAILCQYAHISIEHRFTKLQSDWKDMDREITSILYPNVKLAKGFSFKPKDFKDPFESFQNTMDSLPEGLYSVGVYGETSRLAKFLFGDHRAGHAIVFQKTKEFSFVYDPNIGSIPVSSNNLAEDLIEYISSYRLGCSYDTMLIQKVDTSSYHL